MDQDYTLRDRLDTSYLAIQRITDPKNRMNLSKMYHTCIGIWTELNKEFVTCRRLHKLTRQYLELETKMEEHVNNLEQYLVFAQLMN